MNPRTRSDGSRNESSDVTASGASRSAPDAAVTGAVSFGSGVPPTVDAFEFARRGQLLAGAFAVQRLGRLLEGLAPQPVADLPKVPGMPATAGVVVYRAQGRMGQDGKPYLSLLVQARLLLECQRCLGPLELPVDHQAEFELVRNDADLDADVTELDDEDFDRPEKVVGSRRFDLAGLIEDELILEVPFIPRHAHCPGAADEAADPAEPEQAEVRASPFAALGQLKPKNQ